MENDLSCFNQIIYPQNESGDSKKANITYLEIKKKVESTQNQLNRANDELSKYKKEVNKLKNDNDVLKEMSNERIRKFWLMYDDNT